MDIKIMIINYRKSFFTTYLLLSLFTGLLVTNSNSQDFPLNVRLTIAAWEAYNNKNFKVAIAKSVECINEFGPSAINEEINLENNNIPIPPEGTVNETQRNEIIRRGLLNDVATCWFIKGRSLEKDGKTNEAIKAYRETERYKYARVWDPSWGGFWSPAKAANDRRDSLEAEGPK
jgi:hypothetical protein